jgi:hypothetical protein
MEVFKKGRAKEKAGAEKKSICASKASIWKQSLVETMPAAKRRVFLQQMAHREWCGSQERTLSLKAGASAEASVRTCGHQKALVLSVFGMPILSVAWVILQVRVPGGTYRVSLIQFVQYDPRTDSEACHPVGGFL